MIIYLKFFGEVYNKIDRIHLTPPPPTALPVIPTSRTPQLSVLLPFDEHDGQHVPTVRATAVLRPEHRTVAVLQGRHPSV